MRVDILERSTSTDELAFEIVERKGIGHPDTLSDDLAEELSRSYSRYTIEHFGAVLHHNFDKVGLLGGRSHVAFGAGWMTSPIRVLLNGRASVRFGPNSIPISDLLTETARDFLVGRLPLLDRLADIALQDNLSTGSSPGYVASAVGDGARNTWFEPKGLSDLRELTVLASNDTAVGCAHWPLSPTEKVVLDLETRLTSQSYQSQHVWIGTDIKVMACRVGYELDVTLCVPQIANHVPDLDSYHANLEYLHTDVRSLIESDVPEMAVKVSINTKDDFVRPELYLTAIGSSIESGDEGLVGRGNRVNRMIAMRRPYSMEGVCGKNPVYHVGKLYGVLAQQAAQCIYEEFGVPVEVWFVSQEGRDLQDPWHVVVATGKGRLPEAEIRSILDGLLGGIADVTKALVSGTILVC